MRFALSVSQAIRLFNFVIILIFGIISYTIMKLCSACLLGVKCRYDGKSRPHKGVIELSRRKVLIAVCPEQLGGLSTPRSPSERKGKKVFMKTGKNVTKNFENGAKKALKLARLLGIEEAIFKQRSAACGVGQIYDGTFSGRIIEGNGVATELLRKNGIKVVSEEDIGESACRRRI